MVFNYLKNISQMIVVNRRTIIMNMCEDLVKTKLIDFDNIENSGSKFTQRRKRMTPI